MVDIVALDASNSGRSEQCPKCFSKGSLIYNISLAENSKRTRVKCLACGAAGEWADDLENAWKAWKAKDNWTGEETAGMVERENA